ncbi:MAG: hypothetical protein V7681_17425 [Halopseudomonas sabulinigri]
MYENFDLYLQYLEAVKSDLPLQVFEFASDEKRHNLDSAHSLHDAWLTSLVVKENRNTQRPFEPKPTIELVLLGPQHDRDIVLSYVNVSSYRAESEQNCFNAADTLHGDVDLHEVRVSEGGLVVHEIKFSSCSRIIITCDNFICTEREYTQSATAAGDI